MHLSFQIINPVDPKDKIVQKGKSVEIDVDDEGLNSLITILTKLRGSGSHVHLRAGAELSDRTPFGSEAVSEIIISHGGD